MYKVVLVVCVQALLIQSAFSACAGRGYSPNNAGLGMNGLTGCPGTGCGCGVASTGGGFPVNSATAYPSIGLSVVSENSYQGTLYVRGNLPFVGTVGIEGVMATAGAGAVSYGCGNGNIGIGAEAAPGSYGPGIAGPGYGPGGAGTGCGAGCGASCGCGCGCGGRY